MIRAFPACRHCFVAFFSCQHYGRVLYLEQVKQGLLPDINSLAASSWLGWVSEVRAGRKPLPTVYCTENPVPQRPAAPQHVRVAARPNDYSVLSYGHNGIYWRPFLRRFGALRCHIVSLLFAREPLNQKPRLIPA